MTKEKFIKSNASIRWVIALKEEAAIILDQYKMNFLPEFKLFKVYRNYERTQWLVISGIGRHNAAAAATFLYLISGASRSTAWINLGIAGSGIGNYGDLCLVNKISNNSPFITYPKFIPKTRYKKMSLFTSDVPVIEYSSHELIDMEGSAFYDITSKFAGREFICLIKVVSDNPNNKVQDVNKSTINRLIKLNIKHIKAITSYYEKLSMDEAKIIEKPDVFWQISSQWHFTISQKHQLNGLIKRLKTLCKDNEVIELIKDCNNSRSVISNLEMKILNTAVDWSKI